MYISNAAVPLLTFLGSQSPELVYTCLQHIQLLLAKEVGSFAESYQAFFCRYSTDSGRSHEWASVLQWISKCSLHTCMYMYMYAHENSQYHTTDRKNLKQKELI